MNAMNREELKSLATEQHPLCISIYSPLHRRYPHTQEDQSRVRALLDEARAKLADRELGEPQIERFLKPGFDLLAHPDFWQADGSRGLAILLAVDSSGAPKVNAYRLPYPVEAQVDIAGQFHLTPLVRLLESTAEFHVLALGQKSVRLFACRTGKLEPLPLPHGVPESFEAFTAEIDAGKPTQVRLSAGAKSTGNETAIVHGQSNHKDERKVRVKEFISHVAKEIDRWLEGREAPMVLAAVKSHHPTFQETCRSGHLVDLGIHGSPDELTNTELLEQSTECVAKWRDRQFSEFDGRFKTRMAHGHASCEIESIVPAAAAGRIESLVVADTARVWGRFEKNDKIAIVDDERSPENLDLVNLAVIETLAHDGIVHSTANEHVPDGSAAAAILRW